MDMEVIMESPAEGQVFESGQPIPLIVSLKNNGPNTLLAGDTLIALLPGAGGLQISSILLPQALDSGTTIEIINTTINNISVKETTTAPYCVAVMPNPSDGSISIGGVPLSLTYIDLIDSNNTACNNMTIEVAPTLITSLTNDNQLAFYPNPASSEIMIPIRQHVGSCKIAIVDLAGRRVLEKAYDGPELQHKKQLKLDVSSLDEGIYIIEQHTTQGKASAKLLIQR